MPLASYSFLLCQLFEEGENVDFTPLLLFLGEGVGDEGLSRHYPP